LLEEKLEFVEEMKFSAVHAIHISCISACFIGDNNFKWP